MSTRTDPSRALTSVPFSPRITSRTSVGKPTMVKTMSDRAATSPGVSAHAAPRSSSASARDRVRENTVTGYPASSRCPHIDEPITPLPIQPSDSRDELAMRPPPWIVVRPHRIGVTTIASLAIR